MSIFLSVVAFLLGSALARFAGAVAARCKKKLPLFRAMASCPVCKTPSTRWERLPILSQLLFRGRCRHCKAQIGWFGFCCEVVGGIGFLAVKLLCTQKGARLTEMLLLFALVFLFLVMAAVDHETHDVYNSTLILFALLTVLLLAERHALRPPTLWNHLGGLVFGFAFFLSVAFLGKAILKREALGMGDVFIAGIGGLLLGTLRLLLAILLASLLGSVIELCKIKSGRVERSAELAFAPYLLFGIGLFAVCGQAIADFLWRVVL